jgi:cobalamin biosynthesis protein CobT
MREKTLGVNKLILPFYYVACDQLGDDYKHGSDDIADILRARQWTDWRDYRFKRFSDEEVAAALAKMATTIKNSIRELAAIVIASKQTVETTEMIDLSSESVLSTAKHRAIDTAQQNIFVFDVPEARPTLDKRLRTIGVTEPYYAYTKAFDEIIDAGDLADDADQMALYRRLSRHSSQLKKQHAEALSAKLSCFQKRDRLDSKLAISIIIDNSGSMRGRPITSTAAWCLLIIEWLERLGIPTEVLGFTTRAWKGGQSKEAWIADEKPYSPGRLNDLRHLIYKSFSATGEISAPNFGIMMLDGLLKENIDGEALLWATSRLSGHPAEHKILFVFSDGAPVDDSTLSTNPGTFLERHLQNVIGEISKIVTVYAVGIGHDVSRYYSNSALVADSEHIGFSFFDLLVEDQSFQKFWTKPK